jgi:hypothetical protein
MFAARGNKPKPQTKKHEKHNQNKLRHALQNLRVSVRPEFTWSQLLP